MSNFEESIKKWVQIDNQLKILQDKSKELRNERQDIGDDILGYVETNSLSNATVRINDGRLRFTTVSQPAPLTLAYVKDCLGKCIQNETQVDAIMQYIKQNRSTKAKPEIKRYYAKQE
jgi:hypothetical protein